MTIPSDLRVTIELGTRRVELSADDFDRPGYRIVRGFLASLVSGKEGGGGLIGLSLFPNADASEKRVSIPERSGGREGVQGKPSGEPDADDVDNFAAYLADALDDQKSLAWYRLPQRHVKPVLEAYNREPDASRFGISQALTLAAQSLTPEDRLELERAAGHYLADFAN
jgi:hypothetical protein